MALTLLPLLTIDLRIRLDPLVTCSDASETGGGDPADVALKPRWFNLKIRAPAALVPRALRPVPKLPVFGDTDHTRNFAEQMEGVESLFCRRVERMVLLPQDTSSSIADNEVRE